MPFKKEAVDGFGNIVKTLVHTKLFLSAEQTGSGGAQNVAHGLGGTPSVVAVFITGDAKIAWSAIAITEGTHDATNVVVTVTASVKYRVLALANE